MRWYLAIKLPLMVDLYFHGPLSTFLSHITGLPIE
jgi:hypothetical protein